MLKYFRCYGNLKFIHIFYWKIEKKEDICSNLIADIMTKVYQKYFLSGPLPNIYDLCPNLWIWLLKYFSYCDTFHWLTMAIYNNNIYCCPILDILTYYFRNVCWVVPYRAFFFLIPRFDLLPLQLTMTTEWLKCRINTSFYSCSLRWAIVANEPLVVISNCRKNILTDKRNDTDLLCQRFWRKRRHLIFVILK